jgi:hypothetical protein
MPAQTLLISTPAILSAALTALFIDSTVASILTTTPFLKPLLGASPFPITSIVPEEFFLATITHIFVEPLSNHTKISLCTI